MPIDIRLPVLALSRAVASPKATHLDWTHTKADDLVAFVQGNGGTTGPLTLQLVQGTRTLETIDVGNLVDRSVDKQAQEPVVLPLEKLPIFGSFREAALALCYRLSHDQVHRMQIRFGTQQERISVTDTFSRRGMSFKPERPHTAKRDLSSRQDTAIQSIRPITALLPHSTAIQGAQSVRPGPLSQSLGTGGLSKGFQSHARENQPSDDNRQFSPGYAPPPRILTRQFAEPELPSQLDNSTQLPSSGSIEPASSSWSIPDLREGRPDSAISRISTSSALDLAPLPKPDYSKNKRPGTSSQARLSTHATKDSPVRPGSASVRPKTGVAVRVPDAEKVVRPPSRNDLQWRSTPALGNMASSYIPGSEFHARTSQSILHAGNGSLLERDHTSRVSRLDSRLDAPHEVVSPSPPRKIAPRPQEMGPPVSPIRGIVQGGTAITSSSDPVEADTLDRYAAQSQEDRQAMLEKFIVDNIENPSFVTLCEDMDACWQHVVRGL